MIPRFLLAVATALLLTACAKDAAKPEAAEAEADTAAVELHFHAIAGLNPGANGQAAPVRVRIFELKNAATFSRSDYFALADRAQSTLGLDLLDQDEVVILPGQQLSIQRDLDPSTRQIGLLVGYRELDRAEWRTVLNPCPIRIGAPMSWNNRVVWSEGMFIGTQHFQQHDRYLENLIDARSRPLSAGAWGFSELLIDQGLLAQGKLAIVSARGLLPDGTPFNIPQDDLAPSPLNIDDNLRDGLVYLALPLKRAGARDTVDEGEALEAARYVSQVREVRDDN
eukprot:gene17532-20980_t